MLTSSPTEPCLFVWNLIDGKEETWQFSSLNPLTYTPASPQLSAFSPTLTQCLHLDLKQTRQARQAAPCSSPHSSLMRRYGSRSQSRVMSTASFSKSAVMDFNDSVEADRFETPS